VRVSGARVSPRGDGEERSGDGARAGFGAGLLLCSDIDFYEDLARKSRTEL
jgi:hypothetical protein